MSSTACIASTHFATNLEQKGAKISSKDNEVVVSARKILDSFGFPLTRKIKGKNYILVQVMTSCAITREENGNKRVYEEVTVQGKIPENINKKDIIYSTHSDKKLRTFANRKESKDSYGKVLMEAAYVPTENN